MFAHMSKMIPRAVTRVFNRPSACIFCQWRSFSTSYRLLADKPSPKSSETPPPPPDPKEVLLKKELPKHADLVHAPRSYGQGVEEFTPTALSRPIGMHFPPNPGENTGIDMRTIKGRDDFVDYTKHLQKRQQL
jgi:mitochondrial ATPase complex subunit ATP10